MGIIDTIEKRMLKLLLAGGLIATTIFVFSCGQGMCPLRTTCSTSGGPVDTFQSDYIRRTDCFTTRASSLGALDTSFNGGATLNIDVTPAQQDYPLDYVSQYVNLSSDCKYLFMEYTPSGPATKVYKVTPAGAVDTSYGTAGVANISYAGYTGATYYVISRQDVAYLVLDKKYVLKIKADGTQDTSYGTAGVATAATNSAASLGGAVQVDKAGRIYVGGSNGSNDSMITRLLANGQVDTSFGTAGSVTQDITYYDGDSAIASIQIGCDGTVWAAGVPTQNAGGSVSHFVLKYSTNGVLDTSFGTAGMAVTTMGGRHPQAKFFFALDRTTNQFLLGTQNSGFANVQLTRMNSDGSIDTAFGTAGVFSAPNFSHDGFEYIQNGKVILTGDTGFTVLNLVGIN